jgi:hypothetical protein
VLKISRDGENRLIANGLPYISIKDTGDMDGVVPTGQADNSETPRASG